MTAYGLGFASVIGETDDAIHVVIHDRRQHHWVPKSQIHRESDRLSMRCREGNLVVSEWWAETVGLL